MKKNLTGTSISQSKAFIMQFLIKHKMVFLMAGFYILCIYPVFTSWYYGDDLVSSDILLYMKSENRNLLQYIANQMQYYVVNLGRFYPLHVIHRFLTFYLLDQITAYRIFVFLLNFLAIFSFASMAKAYSGSKRLFYAIMLLYPGIFLFFTRYDDAITSYYMFIQMLVIYLSLSLTWLKIYITEKKKVFLILSVLLYLFSLLTYESSYLLVLIYPLAFFYLQSAPPTFKMIHPDTITVLQLDRMNETTKPESLAAASIEKSPPTISQRKICTFAARAVKAVKDSLPYWITAFLCFWAYGCFSMNAVAEYQGIQFSLDPGKIALTFLKQVIAAFPIVPHAWIIFDMNGKIIFDLRQVVSNVTIMDIFSTIVFISFCIILLRPKNEDSTNHLNKGFLIWLSLLLIIAPSLIIAVSSKYQQTLIWGLGYLTIYMTRFGILLIGYFLYERLISRRKKGFFRGFLQTFVIICLATIFLFCQQGNRETIAIKNQSTNLRHIAEKSVEAGLLEGIPDQSIILLGNMWYDYLSHSRNSIFSDLCGAKVTTDTIDNFIRVSWENTGQFKTYQYSDLNVYYFHFTKFDEKSGYAFSAKLDTLSIDATDITGLYATNFKLFYMGDECDTFRIAVKEGAEFVQKSLPLVSTGSGTYMIAVPGMVDLETLEMVGKIYPSYRSIR